MGAVTQQSVNPPVYLFDMEFAFTYTPKTAGRRPAPPQRRPELPDHLDDRDSIARKAGRDEEIGGAMALTLSDKPFYVGLGLGLVHCGHRDRRDASLLVTPINDEIKGDEAQVAELDKKIEQGRAAERKLPQFRAEVARLEQELEKLRRILPSTRNTEEIIQKIKALVDQGDFGLRKLTFPKLGVAKGGDPYAEWPITVSVDGRYHNLAILFNRLGNFSRIMNVESITIKALQSQVEKTISADFIAKTFVYVEPTRGGGAGQEGRKPGGGEESRRRRE